MVNKYIKIARYFSIIKKITAVNFAKLFINEIITYYDYLKNIVFNKSVKLH